MNRKRVLLLVGSPRASKSTSGALATYLSELLINKGTETEKLDIPHCVSSKGGLENLKAAISVSDVMVLSFPLYIDSLPSPVIKAMEFIAQEREKGKGTHRTRFLAICNSGFPEAVQSEVALAICRKFSSEAGFEWIGGLALGGGEAIAGEALKKAGGKARFVRKSLELTADAIAGGTGMPEKALRLMARPFIPKWMYILVGGLGWKWKAYRNQSLGKIKDRPYA